MNSKSDARHKDDAGEAALGRLFDDRSDTGTLGSKVMDQTLEPPTLGSGEFTFVPEPGWLDLPSDLALGDVAAIAVDDRDQVYLFNRGPHPMIVTTREGAFLRGWGEGLFKNPHGVHFAADGCLYCTDEGDHTVRKCAPDGRVLMQLGVPNQPSAFMSGQPFCRCCHTALAPNGDIYVADGYGNARVHKYAPDGTYLFSWGGPGTDAGQFNLPHNICVAGSRRCLAPPSGPMGCVGCGGWD